MAYDHQIFRTQSLPNFRHSFYTLSIRSPGALNAELISYTFPISPQSIRKSPRSLTNVYDVENSAPTSQGVTRVADKYGMAPPMYVIEGTTGWQPHSTDGFNYTGLESIQALQGLLAQYATLTNAQAQITALASQVGSDIGGAIGSAVGDLTGSVSAGAYGASLGGDIGQALSNYSLEFYDYFSDEYWVVEPVGEQIIQQSVQRPFLSYYRLSFAAIQPVGSAIFGAIDVISDLFDIPGIQQLNNVVQNIGAGLALYGLNGRAY